MKKGTLVQIQPVKQIAILVEDVEHHASSVLALHMTREHPRPMLLRLDIENGLLYFSNDRGRFLQDGYDFEAELIQLKRMVTYAKVGQMSLSQLWNTRKQLEKDIQDGIDTEDTWIDLDVVNFAIRTGMQALQDIVNASN
jgi:hypothetical protein